MKIKEILIAAISAAFISCSAESDRENKNIVECPKEIANRAFRFAELYKDSETVYKWGGQDPARAIAIDCSGLVVMCYKYALVDTKYSLLVSDMSSAYMHENASVQIPLEKMRKGDLIFMGEEDSDKITHIALFDCAENGEIYFIDSTEKENVSGVSRRSYAVNDNHFKSFGVMKLQF